MEHISIKELKTFDEYGGNTTVADGLLAIASAINRLADAVDVTTEIAQAWVALIEERDTQVNIEHDR